MTLSADLISSIRLVHKIRLIRRSDIAAFFAVVAVHLFSTSGVKAQAHCKNTNTREILSREWPLLSSRTSSLNDYVR